ncbi:uncharacterized protein LOC142978425 isoform X2 [Anticarsia gemmatalis]|uniref:uncharacterized protein LOC142978425 isoform X2 n=1 Tax=Anticarsia gemmatalis TaxID=129554 RepID=UPI003F75EA5D
MTNIKVFLLIFVLHHSFSSSRSEGLSHEDWENILDYLESILEKLVPNNESNEAEQCPPGQSSLSEEDVAELIVHVANEQHIHENIVNSYHQKAMDVNNKYLEQLQYIQKEVEHPPSHIKDLLEDIQIDRLKAEPIINQLAEKLQEIDAHENKLSEVAERSNKLLGKFENYKEICRLNCGYSEFVDKIARKKEVNVYSHCWRLLDLLKVVDENLTGFQNNYIAALKNKIDNIDSSFSSKMSDFKTDLMSSAMQLFGETMYNLLKLQDDYHHSIKDISQLNVTSELNNVKQNTLKIEFMLVTLEQDVEKYREYCLSCHKNRVKHGNDFSHTLTRLLAKLAVLEEHIAKQEFSENMKTVNDIIYDVIEVIKQDIDSNITEIFSTLNEHLNDPNLVESYLKKLEPIKDEANADIESEQRALDSLKSRIPKTSLDKMLSLVNKSNEVLVTLKSVQDFIDNVIP